MSTSLLYIGELKATDTVVKPNGDEAPNLPPSGSAWLHDGEVIQVVAHLPEGGFTILRAVTTTSRAAKHKPAYWQSVEIYRA